MFSFVVRLKIVWWRKGCHTGGTKETLSFNRDSFFSIDTACLRKCPTLVWRRFTAISIFGLLRAWREIIISHFYAKWYQIQAGKGKYLWYPTDEIANVEHFLIVVENTKIYEKYDRIDVHASVFTSADIWQISQISQQKAKKQCPLDNIRGTIC